MQAATTLALEQSHKPGTMTAHRPKVYFRPEGALRDKVSLEIVPPSIEGATPDKVIELVEAKTAEREDAVREAFRREGRTFMGAHAVKKQHVTDSPTTWAPRRKLSPRIAAKNKWRRIRR